MFCLHVCLCTTCVPHSRGCQTGVLDPLGGVTVDCEPPCHHHFIIYAPAILEQCGQSVYGGSPVVPNLGNPRCLCYVIAKVPQSSCMLSVQCSLGLPLRLIPCTPPSSAICRYLLSFILITWPKSQVPCRILQFIFCRWRCFLWSYHVSLEIGPRSFGRTVSICNH